MFVLGSVINIDSCLCSYQYGPLCHQPRGSVVGISTPCRVEEVRQDRKSLNDLKVLK